MTGVDQPVVGLLGREFDLLFAWRHRCLLPNRPGRWRAGERRLAAWSRRHAARRGKAAGRSQTARPARRASGPRARPSTTNAAIMTMMPSTVRMYVPVGPPGRTSRTRAMSSLHSSNGKLSIIGVLLSSLAPAPRSVPVRTERTPRAGSVPTPPPRRSGRTMISGTRSNSGKKSCWNSAMSRPSSSTSGGTRRRFSFLRTQAAT